MLLRMNLSAQTPLSFREGTDLMRGDLNRYIPGAAILGGLAEAHVELRNTPAEFEEFFLRDKLRIGNGYPADFKARELQSDDRAVQPLPATARSCKRFKGFKYQADIDRERRAGVTDLLIPLALFTLSGETRVDLLDAWRDHPETGFALDRYEGFFRRGGTSEQIGRADTGLAIRSRTGINYRTGAVQSAILYNRQVLAEGSSFWGSCWVDPSICDDLEDFLDLLSERDRLRIGNNRTRGFGHISLNLRRFTVDRADDLGARVEQFSSLFRAAADAAQVDLPEGIFVPITLTSDMLLSDALLRARLQLQRGDLTGFSGAELLFQAAGQRQVRGWNTLWGLPKRDDRAIRMGSVFLFRIPEGGPQVWQALLQLQEQGIGLRRSEGFGSIAIADRFHIESAGGAFR